MFLHKYTKTHYAQQSLQKFLLPRFSASYIVVLVAIVQP